jgi:hypothetical protein
MRKLVLSLLKMVVKMMVKSTEDWILRRESTAEDGARV